MRPIDHLDLDISEGAARPRPRGQRLRQDHLALRAGVDPDTHDRFDRAPARRRAIEVTAARCRADGLPAVVGRHRLPGLQPGAEPFGGGERGRAAPRRRDSRRRALERARTLLADVELSDRLDHRPSGLSGGQQQRVAIARALAADPPLVLADEPTAQLDYVQVEGVLRLLRSLAGPGRIVVVATHDERLLPMADGIIELSPRVAPGHAARVERTLAPGEVLFRQGDPGDLVYVVERARSRSAASGSTARTRSWPATARASTSASWPRCTGCAARRRRGPSSPLRSSGTHRPSSATWCTAATA